VKVCPWCAEELPDDARVCTQCGKDPDETPEWKRRPAAASASSVPGLGPPGSPPGPDTPMFAGTETRAATINRLAKIAFAIVIVSFAIGFLFPRVEVSLIADAVGLVLGVAALQQIRDSHGAQRGTEWALTAVILGGLGLLLYLISLAVR
jgi:hypothetical protein